MSDLKKLVADKVAALSIEKKLKAELVEYKKLRDGTPIREFGPVAVKSTVEAAATQIVNIHGALCPGNQLRYAIDFISAETLGGKTYLTLRVAVEDTRPESGNKKAPPAPKSEPLAVAAKDDPADFED